MDLDVGPVSIVFSDGALINGSAFDVYCGDNIALHIKYVELRSGFVLNDFRGGVWGEERFVLARRCASGIGISVTLRLQGGALILGLPDGIQYIFLSRFDLIGPLRTCAQLGITSGITSEIAELRPSLASKSPDFTCSLCAGRGSAALSYRDARIVPDRADFYDLPMGPLVLASHHDRNDIESGPLSPFVFYVSENFDVTSLNYLPLTAVAFSESGAKNLHEVIESLSLLRSSPSLSVIRFSHPEGLEISVLANLLSSVAVGLISYLNKINAQLVDIKCKFANLIEAFRELEGRSDVSM